MMRTMTYEDLGHLAQGYVAGMVESQEFWPDDFETNFEMFELAEVGHFLPGAYLSVRKDCSRFMRLSAEQLCTLSIVNRFTDDECYRIGRLLWYRRIGSDRGFETGDGAMDRAMNAAAQKLGRPVVRFCSIGYIQHEKPAR